MIAEAPAIFLTPVQPCQGTGRFVRIRLPGTGRSLDLAEVELFAVTALPPAPPAVDFTLLSRLIPPQAYFPLTGESATSCVDANT